MKKFKVTWAVSALVCIYGAAVTDWNINALKALLTGCCATMLCVNAYELFIDKEDGDDDGGE